MITVYGLLGAPTPQLRDAASDADWVVGGRRHLDALSIPPGRRITLGALRPAIDTILTLPADVRIVVVASGDPLFFGVVRSLRARGLHPDVVTAPSSVAAAFAAVGVPWEDAAVVTVHGRTIAPAINVAYAHPKVAVFTSAENSVRELAAGLASVTRWFVVAERLGEDDQRVHVLDSAAARVAEPREPNVVLILAKNPADTTDEPAVDIAGASRPPRPTVSGAAAVAFARLLPEPGESLWVSGDIGRDVAALAHWAGAAAHTIGHRDENDTRLPFPDTICAEAGAGIDWLRNSSPRAVVLTGPTPQLPENYRWASETIDGNLVTSGVRA